MDVTGAMYMSPYHGMSSHIILGKLPRLAGADIAVFPLPYGKATFINMVRDKYLNVWRNLTFPFYQLKPVFPMPGGGVTPSMVPQIMNDLGNEVVVGVGGAIHGHPQGPRAGARAFRQAIDATMQGISLTEAAKKHPELATALQIWVEPFKEIKGG
jgi:2,3-diketo-5-methylthiopentyl-1-phosphate enolase